MLLPKIFSDYTLQFEIPAILRIIVKNWIIKKIDNPTVNDQSEYVASF